MPRMWGIVWGAAVTGEGSLLEPELHGKKAAGTEAAKPGYVET